LENIILLRYPIPLFVSISRNKEIEDPKTERKRENVPLEIKNGEREHDLEEEEENGEERIK
jgi:hypothetical protein